MPGQRRRDGTRADRISADPKTLQTPVEFHHVQDVRGLRRAVCDELVVVALLPVRVLKTDVPQAVAPGREDHHSGAVGGDQRRSEQPGQLEVTEMVCRQLDLESVGAAVQRREHHPGVVHQHIERRRHLLDRRRGGPNACQRRQIQMYDRRSGARKLRADPCLCFCDSGTIARRKHHVCARGRQRSCRLPAQPGRRSGDDAGFPRHVDPGDDVQSGEALRHDCGVPAVAWPSRHSGITTSGSHSSSTIHLHMRRIGSMASWGMAIATLQA